MIGKNILTALKNKGISQYKAAKDLGMGASRLNQYITGARTPDPDTILALCKYLNVTTDFLYGNDSSITTTQNETSEIDAEALSEIFEAIEAWEQQKRFKLTTKYKTTLALALYPDVIVEEQTEKKKAIVINFLEAVNKLGQIQKSA